MKNSQVYAIVDIETTGGFAAHNKITEIAILLLKDEEVVDTFHSLINPEMNIPNSISHLTGITNEMVAEAPTFSDLAKEIFDLLNEVIFVAHNVNFDFTFIYHQLKENGFEWNPIKLCTVRLSRKIFPNLNSYSLGKLCSSLNIPIYHRHRALGDATATALLFNKLLQDDQDGWINQMQKKNNLAVRLPLHFDIETFNALPLTCGVYLFKDRNFKVVYVGKANQLKKRVLQHFIGNNTSKRRQEFITEICSVDYIETGSEIMALLEEAKLIQTYWPKFNRALKKFEPKFDIISYQDQSKYLRFAIVKHQKNIKAIKSFDRVYEATNSLLSVIKKYNLNPLYCTFFQQEKLEFVVNSLDQLENNNGNLQIHNENFYLAMDELIGNFKSYVIKLNGRNDEEYGYIYVKEDRVYAFGLVENCIKMNDFVKVIPSSHRCKSSYYMMQLIENYLENNSGNVFYTE